MDKLKKVLSGDDEDEERGIVAEVSCLFIFIWLKFFKLFFTEFVLSLTKLSTSDSESFIRLHD